MTLDPGLIVLLAGVALLCGAFFWFRHLDKAKQTVLLNALKEDASAVKAKLSEAEALVEKQREAIRTIVAQFKEREAKWMAERDATTVDVMRAARNVEILKQEQVLANQIATILPKPSVSTETVEQAKPVANNGVLPV